VPRPREVKDCFESLIGENQAVIRQLENTIAETKLDKAPLEKIYAKMMESFAASLLSPPSEEALAKLSAASGGKIDFMQSYREQMNDSRQAEIRLNGLTATHGELPVLEARFDEAQRELSAAQKTQREKDFAADTLATTLEPVTEFNALAGPAGKPLLQENSMAYFTRSGVNHVFSWLFNSHYRRGHGIIKDMEAPVPELQKQLAAAQASAAAATGVVRTAAGKKSEVEAPLKEMRGTAERIVPKRPSSAA
jgi:hypothetical protein